jgi:hypothetical protein
VQTICYHCVNLWLNRVEHRFLGAAERSAVKQWSNSGRTVVKQWLNRALARLMLASGTRGRAAPEACQCRAMGAIVWPLPLNFSRNDRNVRGRLGRHGLGGLAAPGPKRVTWILYAAGLRRLPGHPCQVSILIPYHHPYLSYILIPIILHTYLNYPKYLSQLSYISCHLSHLSATYLCSG